MEKQQVILVNVLSVFFFFFLGWTYFNLQRRHCGFALSEVASVLQISRPTLYKLMREYNIRHTKVFNISDEEFDATICEIKAEHPHAGEVMFNGHLCARNIVVRRRRLRDSVKRVDGAGVESRRTTTVQVYTSVHEYTLCLVQTIYGT